MNTAIVGKQCLKFVLVRSRLSDDVEDPAKPNTQIAYRGPLRKKERGTVEVGTSGIENGRSGLQLPSRLGLLGTADPLNRSAQTRQNTCQTEGVDGGAREPKGANQRGLCGLDFCQKTARILALEILSTPELSGRQQPTPEELMKNERISRRFCTRGLRSPIYTPRRCSRDSSAPLFS